MKKILIIYNQGERFDLKVFACSEEVYHKAIMMGDEDDDVVKMETMLKEAVGSGHADDCPHDDNEYYNLQTIDAAYRIMDWTW